MENNNLNDESKSQTSEVVNNTDQELEHKLNVTGWALFFIWGRNCLFV